MSPGEIRQVEDLLVRIDERTKNIQKDCMDIKKDITDLYDRTDENRDKINNLKTEHDIRTRNDACIPISNLNMKSLPKWMIATMGGGGIASVISLIIVIALLAHFGLL